MFEEIKYIKSEKSDLRKFGITFSIILIVIAGFLFWRAKELFQIFLNVGGILLFLAVTIPVVLKPIYLIWMTFAGILGWLMTRIILTLLFFLIITPIGIIGGLLGKQFLNLKWKNSKKSFWNYRDNTIKDNSIYEKQF